MKAVLARMLRRTGAHTYDRLAQAGETGAVLALLAQLPVLGAAGLTGGAFGNPDKVADMSVGFGVGGAALGALMGAGQGRRAFLRAMLSGPNPSLRAGMAENIRYMNSERKRAMLRYIRYLREVGFHEEAAEARHAYEMALLDQHGARFRPDDVRQHNVLTGRSESDMGPLADEDAYTLRDYGERRLPP